MARRISPSQHASKGIRFSEKSNETILIKCDVQRDQWYSQEDYKRWKKCFRYQARGFRREGYGVLLENSFEDLNPDVQQYITAFAQLDDARYLRGLEQYASKQHHQDRVVLRDRAIQTVLRLQRNMKRRGLLSADEITEKLSLLLERYSQPARRFAERIGVADEIVAKWGEDPQKADQLSLQLSIRESTECASLGSSRWNSSISDLSLTNSSTPRQPCRRTSDKTVLIVVGQETVEGTSNNEVNQSDVANCSMPRRPNRRTSVTKDDIDEELELQYESSTNNLNPQLSFRGIPRDDDIHIKMARQNSRQTPLRPHCRTSDSKETIVVAQRLAEDENPFTMLQVCPQRPDCLTNSSQLLPPLPA